MDRFLLMWFFVLEASKARSATVFPYGWLYPIGDDNFHIKNAAAL